MHERNNLNKNYQIVKGYNTYFEKLSRFLLQVGKTIP